MPNVSPVVGVDLSGSPWDVAINSGASVQGKSARSANTSDGRRSCLAWVAVPCHFGAVVAFEAPGGLEHDAVEVFHGAGLYRAPSMSNTSRRKE